MQHSERKFVGFDFATVSSLTVFAMFLAAFVPALLKAQQPGQKTFSSCQEAADALAAAAQANDEKALLAIFGPAGKQIVSSGDATEDTESRASFAQRYQEMHRLVKEPDGTTTIYAGAHNWPFPVPLVNKGKVWYFDTTMGRREVLYRRIGRNEISTIRVLQELVAAQKEYWSGHNSEYAAKIFSDPGKQDGLYWKSDNGQPQSPIGPLVASAVAEGYATPQSDDSPATPYRGYYFHILTKQGTGASGGAKSYIADGKLTGGFAFIAYPADYRSSGVMTFIVGSDGTVYRKDLGPNTATLAKAMKAYSPDATWKKDEDQQEESAGATTPVK